MYLMGEEKPADVFRCKLKVSWCKLKLDKET